VPTIPLESVASVNEAMWPCAVKQLDLNKNTSTSFKLLSQQHTHHKHTDTCSQHYLNTSQKYLHDAKADETWHITDSCPLQHSAREKKKTGTNHNDRLHFSTGKTI